jgi:hypothetical protein
MVGVAPDDACCLFAHPVQGFDRARTVFLASFESQDGATKHQATYTLMPETAYRYHVTGGHGVSDCGQ